VNGDFALDLLAADAGEGAVAVLLGNGRGGFRGAPGSPAPAGPAPHLLVTGDFNSDKSIDIAATSHDSNSVFVLLGDGRGKFAFAPGSPFAAYPSGKPHNHGLATADVNADGKLDLTLGHQDSGAIAVLLGDGRGRFTAAPGSPFKLGRGFYPHALGDVNQDGKLDVVAPDIMGSAIVVGLGDGRGGFAGAPGSPVRVKARPYFVLLADVNGDNKLDIVATHDDIDEVDVLLGNGNGRFTATTGFHAGNRGWTVAAADLDGDGSKDLLIAGGEGIKAFLGNGKGGFSPADEWSYPARHSTWKLAIGDVNGDGKVDLAVPNSEGGVVSVALQR
jgi:hypothetical protein